MPVFPRHLNPRAVACLLSLSAVLTLVTSVTSDPLPVPAPGPLSAGLDLPGRNTSSINSPSRQDTGNSRFSSSLAASSSSSSVVRGRAESISKYPGENWQEKTISEDGSVTIDFAAAAQRNRNRKKNSRSRNRKKNPRRRKGSRRGRKKKEEGDGRKQLPVPQPVAAPSAANRSRSFNNNSNNNSSNNSNTAKDSRPSCRGSDCQNETKSNNVLSKPAVSGNSKSNERTGAHGIVSSSRQAAPAQNNTESGNINTGSVKGPVPSSPKEFWTEDIQLGCRELRARRYITDGFCTSEEPIKEVVCAGNCLPIKNIPWFAEFVKTMARSKLNQYQCMEDYTRRKRVRLLCKNGTVRTYRIKVVKSCKCALVRSSRNRPDAVKRLKGRRRNGSRTRGGKSKKRKRRRRKKKKKRKNRRRGPRVSVSKRRSRNNGGAKRSNVASEQTKAASSTVS